MMLKRHAKVVRSGVHAAGRIVVDMQFDLRFVINMIRPALKLHTISKVDKNQICNVTSLLVTDSSYELFK